MEKTTGLARQRGEEKKKCYVQQISFGCCTVLEASSKLKPHHWLKAEQEGLNHYHFSKCQQRLVCARGKSQQVQVRPDFNNLCNLGASSCASDQPFNCKGSDKISCKGSLIKTSMVVLAGLACRLVICYITYRHKFGTSGIAVTKNVPREEREKTTSSLPCTTGFYFSGMTAQKPIWCLSADNILLLSLWVPVLNLPAWLHPRRAWLSGLTDTRIICLFHRADL